MWTEKKMCEEDTGCLKNNVQKCNLICFLQFSLNKRNAI